MALAYVKNIRLIFFGEGKKISVLNLSGGEVEKVVGVVGRHEEGVAARNLCRQNEKKERHYHKIKRFPTKNCVVFKTTVTSPSITMNTCDGKTMYRKGII